MNKLKLTVKFGEQKVKKNGVVNLSLTCPYSGLPKVVQLMQALNVDMDVALHDADKAATLGVVRLGGIWVESDGSSIIHLNGVSDYIQFSTLGKILDYSDEEFVMLFKWELEGEE